MSEKETAAKEEEKKEKKPSKIGLFLNKYFHFYDRGSSMKSEIGAGIGAFMVAVCALLMNTQIIGSAYGNYAGSYLAVTIIAFVGTLLLGLVCNLPLMQSANMATSTVLISMLSVNTGLTYANLMFITFISAIIYLIIVVSPIRSYIVDALPEGVRKALPVAVGLFVMYTALENTGLITDSGLASASDSILSLDQFYFWLLIAATVLFIVLKGFKRKKPFFATYGILLGCMWIGGIIFFMDSFIGGETATVVVYKRLNLFYATDGADPYNIVIGFSSLNFGELFTSGLDFSAFTEAGGSVALVFVEGILTFLLLGMYSNVGNVHAVAITAPDAFVGADGKIVNESKAYILGAALNVVSPILGAPPTSVGTQSAMATGDGAKTGLSSVVTAIGLFIALFTWIFFALFATGVNGVGMWIDETETKLAAYVQDTFIFADLIMVFVGASMLRGIKDCNFADMDELIPFAATIAGTVFAANIAVGVAFGVVLSAVSKLVTKKFKEFTIPVIVISVVMLAYLIVILL